MKKSIWILAILFGMGAMMLTSCAEDDITPPVITILGDNPVDHLLNTTYTDAGATAQDDEDGALIVTVTNPVEHNKIGTYNVEYRAEDNSGNVATAVRTVNIIVKQVSYIFTWAVSDSVVGVGQGIYYYNSTITTSAVANKILIGNFGGFGNPVIVEATFDKFGNITIPNQNLIGAPAGSEGTVTGTGTTSTNGNQLFIQYTISYTAGGTDTGYAVFTKM